MRCFLIGFRWLIPIVLAIVTSSSTVSAQDAKVPEGQADLDAATALKLNASSMADLERVIELAESALEKGLNEQNEFFAKSLLTATLLQHGSRFAQPLLNPRERAQQPAMLKKYALQDLYKILEYDESSPEAYLLIARLEGVNVAPRDKETALKKGVDAADKAIALLGEDKPQLSKALLLRAGYETGNPEKRLELLEQAIAADESNADAWRLRGKTRLLQGEMLSATGELDKAKEVRSQAVEDFLKLLEANPNDADALQSAAELLGRLGEYDRAMEFSNQVVEQNPNAFSGYLLRSRLLHKQKEYDAAISDLNRAVDMNPGSFLAYLDRAEVHLDAGNSRLAAKDYNKARDLQGASLPAVIIQRTLLRSQNDVEKGISQLKQFLELDELSAEMSGREPDTEYRLQLSATYTERTMPQETIEVLTPMIELRKDREYSGNTRDRNAMFLALRSRANAFLGLGQHKEAIDDYKKANSVIPDDPGVLNNLAWVLATSPQDELREPKAAIEFATTACERTQFQAAHILSTLAAAYADSGDFDSAVKYSTQAVELEESVPAEDRDEEMLGQLQKELESYKKKEPWREEQNILEDQKDESENEPNADSPETTESEDVKSDDADQEAAPETPATDDPVGASDQ